MNRKEVFWYTGKLVWRKDAVIICLFWSVVFFCLNGLIVCGKNMNEQKKATVQIQCEISREYQSQLEVLWNMEGIQTIAVWEESTQILEWNGYEAEVTLVGTDPEYLQKQFPEAYSQGKHSSMAWAIVDESMIKQLKDTKKHAIQGYVPEDLLYQTVEINGEKVRIYGINSPEEKQEESQIFVYTDIEKYEEIVMSDTENRESVTDTGTLQGESHSDREVYHYRIQVTNEAAAEKVVDTLSLSGIPVQNTEDLEKQQEQREKIMEKIWQWILGLAGSLLSGVVLIRQQGKLWMAEHQAFVLYMQQISHGAWERIWKNRKVFYIIAGGMAGEILYLLLCMNGWKGY